MLETWADIEEYPNYAISDRGRVRNKQTDRILKPRETDDGALRVTLSRDGEVGHYYVHHLVFKAFFGNFDSTEQIIHANGDRSDNTPSNLRARKRKRPERPVKPEEEAGQMDDGRRWGQRVVIVETGEVFRTVRDCAYYIDGDYASIYACLRGERASHKGYTFEYYYW